MGEATFRDLLSRRGLKFTRVRRLLFDEVLKKRKHFDAGTWYRNLRRRGLPVSRDTVFRTIPLFLEAGILQKSVGEGRGEYFERVDSHHDHLICVGCRKVVEFASGEIESLQDRVAKKKGFELLFHDHKLFGHCRKCRQGAKSQITKF